MTYLEEASNSCSATLVPVHAGHAASGLDVGAAGVVGNALHGNQETSGETQTGVDPRSAGEFESFSPFPPA